MDLIPIPAIAGAFIVAFAVCVALTPAIKPLAFRLGAVSGPKLDRWNVGSIPLLGGIAICAGTAVAAALFVELDVTVLSILLIAGMMFAIGLLDDYFHMKPSTKLTAQIAVGCVALLLGITLTWTASPTLNLLLTLIWIVGITNAFNLLDNMDGLAAGIAAIASLALALTIGEHAPALGVLTMSVGGACAGFLVFNFKPASIFMGDSGSLFIGSMLALLAASAEASARTGIAATLLVPVLIMLIPIFDVTFVTVARKLSARAASQGGTDHSSHRLVAMGFSEREAVLLLYAFAAVAGALAVFLTRQYHREAGALLGLLLVVIVLFGFHLARVKVYDGQDYTALRGKSFTPLLTDVTYKRRLFEVMLDVGLTTLAYYSAYVIRFDDDFDVYYPRFLESLPVVIASTLLSFFAVGVYRGVWRHFSLSDMFVHLRGVGAGTLVSVLALVYLYRLEGYSRGVFIINAMALGMLITGSRASFRFIADFAYRRRTAGRRTLIYGAGDGGNLLLRELRNNGEYDYRPVGFIDDEPLMKGRSVMGLPVIGSSQDLPRLLEQLRPEVVIVSTGKLRPGQLGAVIEMCRAHGAEVHQLDFAIRRVDVLRLARER